MYSAGVNGAALLIWTVVGIIVVGVGGLVYFIAF